MLGETIGSAKIVTTFDDLPALLKEGASWIALTIGGNREQFNLAAQLKTERFSIMTVRHPSSFVKADVRVGEGAVLCTTSFSVQGGIVNTGAIVDHEVCVGAYAHFGPGSCRAGRVTVGERTFAAVGNIPDGVMAYGVPAKARRHV